MGAKAGDLPHADGGDKRLPAELLPGMDVGKVHLHGGQVHGGDGVAERHGGRCTRRD